MNAPRAATPYPTVPALDEQRARSGGALDEQHVRVELRRWIVGRSKAARRGELTDQTELLENGLLSSLDVVELVLFVEELRGFPIDTDEIQPEAFETVDAMWRGFFAAGP